MNIEYVVKLSEKCSVNVNAVLSPFSSSAVENF